MMRRKIAGLSSGNIMSGAETDCDHQRETGKTTTRSEPDGYKIKLEVQGGREKSKWPWVVFGSIVFTAIVGAGYAAYVAGQITGAEIGVTTNEQASWWGGRGIGTVPHALIASYGGDTVLAAKKFAEWAPLDMNVTVLVDFENDSVRTALEVADALGDRLWGVRLDTAESLVDRSLWDEMGDFRPIGVNERLVWKVRDALDERGYERLRIVASGGFTVEKIRYFEAKGVPVDAYGVGSSLIRGSNDFTGDIVMTDGKPSAKIGRHYRENPRLELVT